MRPTIYLGIGGTGIKTLAQIKYQFEKDYGVGNIPKEVAFVGFDFQTDMDKDHRVVCSDKSSATYCAQNNGELDLLQDEFYYIETYLLKRLARLT